MKWCLIKPKADELKRAIKSGKINPTTLSEMTSKQRRSFLEKYVGAENASEVNALFESKLLLKNQKAGYISWAKKITGITPEARRDIISKIENMENVLNPQEEKMFLEDLAKKRLGLEVTAEEAKNISELTKQISDLGKKADENGNFPSEETRLEYGASKVALENYINQIKLEANKISFRQQPIKKIISIIKEIPGTLKSSVASLDNSLWGRQGIKTLMDIRTSKIWAKNFLKSWRDIGRQLKGKGRWYTSGDDAVIDSIKADIYSRPNAILGKYKAGGYGLEVLNEEAYPSSLPEKIPLLGRVFKASETAYNGGALRLRADLADRLIKIAEKNGVNTLNPEEARPIGNLVGSLTGRGSLGKGDVLAKEINTLAFSVKFLKSNFDTLTAGLTDPKIRQNKFARKEAAKSLLSIVATTASILAIAKLIDKDAVEEDPRSSNFGKIKIFGHWTDITGGMAGIVTLASRLAPTLHEGKLSFWKKNNKGEYDDLIAGGYGKQNAMDVFDSFWQGKLSPIAGVVRDMWKGSDYSGNPITLNSVIKKQLPISVQNYESLKNDPNSSFWLGSMILDGLGLSTSSTIEPNIKSNIIPENKKVSNNDLIKTISLYAQSFGTDPETTFNRIFTGQRIRKVSGDAVIVERMPLKESQEVKKKAGADNPTMKLDHTIPLELGGDNSEGNLKLVTTSEWSSYTKVENALGKALSNKKITKNEAQKLIKEFKNITDSTKRKKYGEEIIAKYR